MKNKLLISTVLVLLIVFAARTFAPDGENIDSQIKAWDDRWRPALTEIAVDPEALAVTPQVFEENVKEGTSLIDNPQVKITPTEITYQSKPFNGFENCGTIGRGCPVPKPVPTSSEYDNMISNVNTISKKLDDAKNELPFTTSITPQPHGTPLTVFVQVDGPKLITQILNGNLNLKEVLKLDFSGDYGIAGGYDSKGPKVQTALSNLKKSVEDYNKALEAAKSGGTPPATGGTGEGTPPTTTPPPQVTPPPPQIPPSPPTPQPDPTPTKPQPKPGKEVPPKGVPTTSIPTSESQGELATTFFLTLEYKDEDGSQKTGLYSPYYTIGPHGTKFLINATIDIKNYDFSSAKGIKILSSTLNKDLNDSDFDGVGNDKDLCLNTLTRDIKMKIIGPEGAVLSTPSGKASIIIPEGALETPALMYIGENNKVDEYVDENGCFKYDSDQDGFRDDFDNCRFIKNPMQEDSDKDRIGDVCDPCPNNFVNNCQAAKTVEYIGNVLPVKTQEASAVQQPSAVKKDLFSKDAIASYLVIFLVALLFASIFINSRHPKKEKPAPVFKKYKLSKTKNRKQK